MPDEATIKRWMTKWGALHDTEVNGELTTRHAVTVSGETYGIRTGPQALALIVGGARRADVSIRNSQQIRRLVPTDQGTVSFDGPALWSIFEAVESHQQAVAERAEALEAMVADGSITEGELEKGWS